MFLVNDFLVFFEDKINKALEDKKIRVERLNTKDDLLKIGSKIKAFWQYAGIDYKDDKSGAGVVNIVFYVAGRKIFNDDNSIPLILDNIREALYNLDIEIEQGYSFGYLADYPLFVEEKYNNTDTMEFIYSLVVGVPILI